MYNGNMHACAEVLKKQELKCAGAIRGDWDSELVQNTETQTINLTLTTEFDDR